MNSLVITQTLLARFYQYSITDEWFDKFDLPDDDHGLKRVYVGGNVYLLEQNVESDETPVVVINNSGENAIFNSTNNKTQILDRIILVAEAINSSAVTIPIQWRPFHQGQIISIYAGSAVKHEGARIHFMRMRDSSDIFVFSKTQSTVDFERLNHNFHVFDNAKSLFADAILSDPEPQNTASSAGIVLSKRLPHGFVQGTNLEDWYKSKLTAEQREFVEKGYDGPVRLRGSAGTGKTVSLVIKFARDTLAFEAHKQRWRMVFLTHSAASVDLVSSMLDTIVPGGVRGLNGEYASVEMKTLYDLANDYMRFDTNNLHPLSLDGREGRRLQFEIVSNVLKELLSSKPVRIKYDSISTELSERWKDSCRGADDRFIVDIMNEFASVLDAENIRKGEESAERYAASVTDRPSWLLPLPNKIDRNFLLEVHERYRRMLSEMGALSVDQMISDFNSYLDSNIWDRIRDNQGYNAIFVDELHLFTSLERQVLHKCLRRQKEEDGTPKRPSIFMAYDVKQSTSDTFMSYFSQKGTLFTESSKLVHSELVQLNKVFRYTPQIAQFLQDLDATFPAIDIPGEWGAYVGTAQLENGDKVILREFPDEVTLFQRLFAEASKIARASRMRGRRVAILCVSPTMFDTYLASASGQFSGKFIPIYDRASTTEMRHAGNRFIFSMPEYVAGLQFEVVFLINVDSQEAPIDSGIGLRRRFVSRVYLGASRAEKRLVVASCMSRGGRSDILEMALERRTLRQE